MTDRLSVAVGVHRPDWFLDIVREAEPRIDLRYEEALYKRDRTPDEQAEFDAMFVDVDAILGPPDHSGRQLAKAIRANPGLRWVHTIPAGGGQQVRAAKLAPDELDRVLFTTSAGMHAGPLSEFALFGVLAGAKQLPLLTEAKDAGRWGIGRTLAMLDEMTVLVVGMGGIGRETARRLAALGCRVIGVSRHEVEGFETVRVEQLADAASTADAIVLALPGTDQTVGMLSAAVLERLKPGATIVNVGRGTTIDEPALIAALQDGRVGLAVLDVTAVEPTPEDSPLWRLPNVVLAPHIAAVTDRNEERIARLFAENATRLLDGRELLNRVNTVEFY